MCGMWNKYLDINRNSVIACYEEKVSEKYIFFVALQ